MRIHENRTGCPPRRIATRGRRRRGQGTTEFALMIPLLFAIAFFVIEFAFYFGTIHWDNYAAFAAARSVQVGGSYNNVDTYLLDGNITGDASLSTGRDRATVRQPYEVDMPGIEQLVGDIDFEVTVVLGPEEAKYENQISSLTQKFADNNM